MMCDRLYVMPRFLKKEKKKKKKRKKKREKILFLRNSPPTHLSPHLASFHTTQFSLFLSMALPHSHFNLFRSFYPSPSQAIHLQQEPLESPQESSQAPLSPILQGKALKFKVFKLLLFSLPYLSNLSDIQVIKEVSFDFWWIYWRNGQGVC